MRVLLADDHDMVRETIAAYLTADGGIDVKAVCDAHAAFDAMQTDGSFDLVLLDYQMPGMNSIEVLKRALVANGGKGVAILSGSGSPRLAKEVLDAGAAGFVPKTISGLTLSNAVKFMCAGEVFIPHDLLIESTVAPTHPLLDGLSPRQIQVLEGVCNAKTNKEIARELELEEVTIKFHVRTLCRKLEVQNRTQAALAAKSAGLF
ncbi:response regulator transcription factor [Tritonibacter mobilis]|nr:response regulator transcription factor [Tritonibacter mobilis]